MTAPVVSLFGAPTDDPLEAAISWLAGLFSGEFAITLCVIAVALGGLLLMSGRVAIRQMVGVALGCFILLGAPLIATGLRAAAAPASASARPEFVQAGISPAALPPANYDPYAGASLRR